MEKMNLLTLIITLVVGVILAGSLLAPVVQDVSETERTFTNEGRYYVQTEIDGETTITMDYDVEGATRQWFIDGELLQIADHPEGSEFVANTTVAGTDNYVFRTDGRCRGLSTSIGNSDYTITVTAESITNGPYVGNAPLFVASTEKTANVFRNDPSQPAYVLDDSRIIACGYTGGVKTSASDTTGTNVVISIDGSIKDGFTVKTFELDNEFTVANVVVNATTIDGYKALYDFTSIEFDVVSTDNTATHCTYSMVVLPAEVTAELSTHLTPGQISLIGAIPIMVIVALLMAAVGAIALRRAD